LLDTLKFYLKTVFVENDIRLLLQENH